MSTYYAVVKYFDEDTYQKEEEFVLLYATDFSDAAQQIERYYGGLLDVVEIHYHNDEGSLWHFSTDVMSGLELD